MPTSAERLAQMAPTMQAFVRELLALLVDEPVEPQGILSRIEQHVAQLRDYLHAATASSQPPDALSWQLLLKEVRDIANHDAQISAARHEFMRDALVAGFNDVLACKAALQAILEAQQVYNQTLAGMASQMFGLETRERALTRLVDVERRLKRLEEDRDAHQRQAGGSRETDRSGEDG